MTERTSPLFDTHAHIIAADREAYPPAPAERDNPAGPFTVDDLLAGMEALGVTRACVVQRYFYYRNDNSYALDACRAHPTEFTPVIMLDGRDAGAVAELNRIVASQPIGGIRFARPELDVDDTAWMNSPNTMRLWERAAELRLPVAFIMFEPHHFYNLPALRLIAERFPELRIVLDHTGALHGATAEVRRARREPGYVPYVQPPDYGVTQALRDVLGASPNVALKVTGINLGCLTADGVDPARFMRYLVDEFGADRVMLGSDIGQTEGPYERIVAGLRDATRLLTASERKAVEFGTAATWYGDVGT